MSRPRTPTAVLMRRSAFEVHPERAAARENEPQPQGEIGEPPASLNDVQAACWREVVSQMAPGVLKVSDRVWLERAAKLLAKSRVGDLKASEESALQKYLGHMGMNPVERSKVNAGPQKPRDDDERFFAAKKPQAADKVQ